jgi:hypothetical protein
MHQQSPAVWQRWLSMTDHDRPVMDAKTQLRYLKRFGYLMGALAIVLSLTGVIIAACHGQYALALLFVGLTLFWSIPFGQKLFVKRLTPRAKVEATGTTLRPGRSVDVLGAAMMLIGLVTGAAWAVLGVIGEVTWPYGSNYRLGYVIFFGAIALFCAGYLATMIRKHGTAYIRLTPDGYTFAEGFFTGRGTWAEVATVNDDEPVYSMGGSAFRTKRAQPYAWCAISITKSDGNMVAVPNGNLYAKDGQALREWIRFYWQHPEYRGELTDSRGLERLVTWEPAAP